MMLSDPSVFYNGFEKALRRVASKTNIKNSAFVDDHLAPRMINLIILSMLQKQAVFHTLLKKPCFHELAELGAPTCHRALSE